MYFDARTPARWCNATIFGVTYRTLAIPNWGALVDLEPPANGKLDFFLDESDPDEQALGVVTGETMVFFLLGFQSGDDSSRRLYLYIYIHVYMYVCMYIYIYIYYT